MTQALLKTEKRRAAVVICLAYIITFVALPLICLFSLSYLAAHLQATYALGEPRPFYASFVFIFDNVVFEFMIFGILSVVLLGIWQLRLFWFGMFLICWVSLVGAIFLWQVTVGSVSGLFLRSDMQFGMGYALIYAAAMSTLVVNLRRLLARQDIPQRSQPF